MKSEKQILIALLATGVMFGCAKKDAAPRANNSSESNQTEAAQKPQQTPEEKMLEERKLLSRSVDVNNKEGLEALKRGDYDTAEKLFLVALKQVDFYRNQSGRKAMILVNLAAVYEEKEMYLQAVPLLSKAQKLFIRAYGTKHPTVAITLSKLGNVLSKQKRYEEASYVYKTAVNLMEESGNTKGDDYKEALDKLLIALRFNGQGLDAQEVEGKISKLNSKIQ